MNSVILYLHGQGGIAEEAEHYASLFTNCDVVGLDYQATTPWEAEAEFPKLFDAACGQYESVKLIASSLGAYFAMSALAEKNIEEAFFISPVVNMPKLIENMMRLANVSEDDLREAGTVETYFGQTLSWKYLSYAREQEINWKISTHILYGEKDNFTSLKDVSKFAEKIGATLTVMKNGEHWFHTEEQMNFLGRWIMDIK
ncbi:alpha/beta superfamily hydrolase [Scardovia inopinata]|uniref:AB hydrolase-1 domain-containing protein n=1 Tax=Scardovia inopinata F0304 TaxID=641146 RepID=W5IJS9_SCAIO|nr:alpha/beta hydrolase [Scardovia inopinata]EFG27254.1 hypothetical protein HMPREF9020_00895 [Scardovia inopinata F0304]BAR06866.1 hydrolase [Scardovia inopinata JCM 12537]SUV50931.1 alpha/beta superfamily hydrolase [Scardovia inopinata]